MAVGFVASATSGSQASVATFNIGTLGTGARAGIVFVAIHNSATDIITGVTWNGAAMTLIGKATDTDTEPGVVKCYFLDNVTNGVITVSRTNNTVVTVGYAASISAAMATRVSQYITRVSSTQNTNADTSTTGTGASGEVAVDDGSPGTSSMRFAAAFTGAASPVGAGTNSTLLQSLDSTAYGSSFVREATAGQGSRNVGFATGTTDDWAVVAVAVSENNRNASVVATGGGIYTNVGVKGAIRSASVATGGGVFTPSANKQAIRSASVATGGGIFTLDYSVATFKNADYSAVMTGGGVFTPSIKGAHTLPSAIFTGGGIFTPSVKKGAVRSETSTGGGIVTLSLKGAHNKVVNPTGGGVASTAGAKGATSSPAITGGGAVVVTTTKAGVSTVSITGGGVITLTSRKGALSAPVLTGGGAVTLDMTTHRPVSVAATGGGVVTIDGAAYEPGSGPKVSVQATGGGIATVTTQGDHTVSVEITGGGTVTFDTEAFHPAAITGMVRDGNGNPVPGARVDAFRSDTNEFVSTAVANALGLYTVIVPPAVDCFLVSYLDTRTGVSARDIQGVAT
jgi:hypothetical protein